MTTASKGVLYCAICAQPIADDEQQVSMGVPCHVETMACVEALQFHIYNLTRERDALRTERDALQKVTDAMVEQFMVGYENADRDGNTHRFSIRAALYAALAVQPTTEGTHG